MLRRGGHALTAARSDHPVLLRLGNLADVRHAYDIAAREDRFADFIRPVEEQEGASRYARDIKRRAVHRDCLGTQV